MFNSLKIAVLVFSLMLFSSTAVPSQVSAASVLKAVGTVNVEGSSFAHIWYTSVNPVLTGTTTPGTSVSVSIDGKSAAAIVDATGNWSYPLSLTAGDHQIILSSEGVVFSTFTLTIGADVPSGTLGDDTSSSPSSLPVTGATELTLAIAGLGLLLVIGSRFLPKLSVVR